MDRNNLNVFVGILCTFSVTTLTNRLRHVNTTQQTEEEEEKRKGHCAWLVVTLFVQI